MMPSMQAKPPRLSALTRWIGAPAHRRVNWLRCLPSIGIHFPCAAAFWTGVSPVALAMAVGLSVVHVFAVTGFCHRYFSHGLFKTDDGLLALSRRGLIPNLRPVPAHVVSRTLVPGGGRRP